MFKPRASRIRDMPLHKDPSQSLLRWVITFLAFVALVAVTTALLLGSAASNWRERVSGSLTVQILPSPDQNQGHVEIARALNRVTDRLRAEPGVESVESFDVERIDELLKPYLSGDVLRKADLPIPQMIDVKLRSGTRIDSEQLQKKLRQEIEIEGIIVTDHSKLLADLIRLAEALQFVAWLVALMVGGACLLSVILLVRSGIATHHETIELLHLIGARDTYIAEQFQNYAFRMSLRGAFVGIVLFAIALMLLSRMSNSVDALLVERLTFQPSWLLILVPFMIILTGFSALSARLTVLTTLRRMP